MKSTDRTPEKQEDIKKYKKKLKTKYFNEAWEKIMSICTILGGHWPPCIYLVKNTVVHTYMEVPADDYLPSVSTQMPDT